MNNYVPVLSEKDSATFEFDTKCARVIRQINSFAIAGEYGWNAFDSVSGVFTEGKEAFPGSAVAEKIHVQ